MQAARPNRPSRSSQRPTRASGWTWSCGRPPTRPGDTASTTRSSATHWTTEWCSMPSVVREWVDKADADFRSAQRLLRARKDPDFDGAFFHSQQCVEKLIKASLIRKRIVPPKTHDLIVL